MRHTIAGAKTSVIAPVPCCQASKARRMVSLLASGVDAPWSVMGER